MGEPKNECGCAACEPPRHWQKFGELCNSACTAPGRYVEGYCVFWSQCVDFATSEARPPNGNEAQCRGYLPTNRELEAFANGLRIGRREAEKNGGRRG